MPRSLPLACAIALALTLSPSEKAAAMSPTPVAVPVTPAASADNPLLQASPLPWQAPPFDRINDAHYLPAFRAGMAQQWQQVQAISGNGAPPDFDNTIVALERSGELLSRVSRVFFGLVQADTNPQREQVQETVAPELAAHSDRIHLDDALFARVDAVYRQRDTLVTDALDRRLIETTWEGFVRAGARLDAAQKQQLSALNVEETTLSTRFHSRLVAATAAAALRIDDATALAGLSPAELAAAASDASVKGQDGKYLLALQNTTQQPALVALDVRDTRQRLLAASMQRTSGGDDNDTRALVTRLAQLRADKARLLGHDSYAAWAIADQMAATPAAARKLLSDTVPAATAKARVELADIQAVVDAQGGGFQAGAADWDHYAEKVRQARFDLDQNAVKAYFPLQQVLEDGVFYAASQLYGLSFKARTDLPVYHPDVQVYEVFDTDGSPLALFYTDYFQRDSKSGGAWMDVFVEQDGLSGSKPVVYNVCNFAKPAAGEPALLSFDDVTTLFHEFGHALHGMFSDVKYPSLAGTNVPRDFVEFPSQFNEHWALHPQVLANYARHWQTGQRLPADLTARILAARSFNQGYATTEYLAAALLDLAWHEQPAGAPAADVDVFEAQALHAAHVDLAAVPPRYRSSYFDHIWGGGYGAGYYAYFWAEVLDHDAYQWFVENGGLSRGNGQTFRDQVLSRGNSRELGQLYRDFRGADPQVGPLLRFRGLD